MVLAAPAHAATYQRQPGITAEHYVFSIEVADNTHAIKGETVATVRFKNNDVDRVAFDLEARKADGTGMTVASVTDAASSAPLHFTHDGDRLTILLGHAAKIDEVLAIRITYGGTPSDGLRFGTTDAKQRAVFSWNWPTKMRDWAPTLDHIASKVTSEFVVTAPEQYTVAANGLLDSEVSLGDGRKVTHWKQGVPITPWLNAVGIARFQTFYGGTERGVPLVIWVPAGEKADVEHGFATARRAIDFFGDTIGPFPFEKLGQVAAPFDGSSTEHASVIFYGDGGTRDGEQPSASRKRPVSFSRAPLLAHEIAHQWFGDSVTEETWGDVWLSEGFATYFADLYTEHYEGRDAFVASLRSERTGALAAERKERDPVVMPADEASGPHLTRVQYAKGGWVLHMLRQQLGSPVFFKAIKIYYGRFKGGNATTEDLRRTMEEVSGQKLGWFFDQWVHRLDSPKLDVVWTYDPQAQLVRLSVTQLQRGLVYRLPLEIGITDAPRGDVHVQRFDMDKKQQDFTIVAAKAPTELLFDPDTKLLADVTLTQR
jgi:aminopeptidase N